MGYLITGVLAVLLGILTAQLAFLFRDMRRNKNR